MIKSKCSGLIMAGGLGERMNRSGVPAHKPLVRVLGLPLMERNFYQLARAGIKHVYISVAEAEAETREFISRDLVPIGESLGVTIEVLIETSPLGNIGAAGLVAGSVEALIVVFADNLSTVDLSQIYEAHLAQNADLTLAVHKEAFRMPFGEIRFDSEEPGRIVDYIEKPSFTVPICSGISVLGTAALEEIPARQPCGLSRLTHLLLDRPMRVRAWPHEEAWVDVNSGGDLARAESLVVENAAVMETWWRGPTEPWLLEVLETCEVRAWAGLSALEEGTAASSALTTFDIAEVTRRRVLRVHVHRARAGDRSRIDAEPPPTVVERARAWCEITKAAAASARAGMLNYQE